MASIKSRFDAYISSSLSINSDSSDLPWRSAYTWALCSLLSKDEDDCWDVLLSSQPSIAFPHISEAPVAPISPPSRLGHDLSGQTKHKRRRNGRHHRKRSSISPAVSQNSSEYDYIDDLWLKPTSPGGRLSHAFCNLGFSFIDYFTPIEDGPVLKSGRTQQPPLLSQHAVDRSTEIDTANEGYTSDWATALCGKRTAVLERRRALSRTSSQDSNVSEPWLEALDRLSHWEDDR
ncbi:hypothetical protein BC939DRAFT_454488 [Gamsiella multidivaricata]|uniref:uncharacterized protein n=1 Tax=Gamsiella multidivaricata TaxID=101098 RepID=UPI002220E150|nr:uncharacterized protein BC939DRAFT_454488 [Gamsiella multidivaricata]KAI7822012.1 hypothetical protein BC939DRAFT_454488 [Gamsiella multidivaricata]